MNSKLSLFRKTSIVVFILSSLLVSGLYVIDALLPRIMKYLNIHGLTSPDVSVGIFVSILTSLVSLFTFLITTFLSVRREKREVRESELTLKQKEIELERARLELEQLKKQVNKKKK